MSDNKTTMGTPVDSNKRGSLLNLGKIGAGLLGAAALPTASLANGPVPIGRGNVCELTPVGLQGPFYLNLNKVRTDIDEGRPGAPLDLRFVLIDTKTCRPYENAVVDLWHCDARGTYSGYPHISPDVPGYTPVPLGQMPREAPMIPPRSADTYCRGAQVTSASGEVRFSTIYPSWYATRTIHLHIKVYLQLPTTGQTAVFTGQLYFDDAVTEAVLARPEYGGRTRPRDTDNTNDRHFVAMNGGDNIMYLRRNVRGYEGIHHLGITLS